MITLDPNLEQILLQSVQGTQEGGMEPGIVDRLMNDVKELAQREEMAGRSPVLLVSPAIRSLLSLLLRSAVPGLHVLAYDEVPDNKQIRVTSAAGGQLEQAV